MFFEYFKDEWLHLEEVKYGIAFKYQIQDLSLCKDDENQCFLLLVRSGFYDVTEGSMINVLMVCINLNNWMEVVKTVVNDDKLWSHYEFITDSTPEYDDLIRRENLTLCMSEKLFARYSWSNLCDLGCLSFSTIYHYE